MQQPIIAIDVGRSAVKVKAFAEGKNYELIFPSVTCPAVRLSDDASAALAAKETVDIDGQRFFTGETAKLQGGVQTAAGLTDDWIETAEYRALIRSAMMRLAAMDVPRIHDPYVVVGTPASHFMAQRARLEEVTRKTVPCTVKALSQPMGSFLSYLLSENGLPIVGRVEDQDKRRLSYAIIDVGYFSTDFLLMKEGVHIESKSASCEGVYVAAEKLMRILFEKKNIKASQLDCDLALRTKKIRHFGSHDIPDAVAEATDAVVAKIIPKAVALFKEEVGALDAVLIGGGGAEVVFNSIHSKWSNSILLPNSRMSVAEGFLRFGKGKQQQQRMTASAKPIGAAHA